MKQNITSNNFVVYALILFGVFILLFFTRNIFSNTQILLDEKATLTSQIQESKENLTRLNNLKNTLYSEGSDAQNEIK